tara:strand:- start:450 stop:1226 length:777 start_codon:yes stop_codon:yes gene_type:complete
MYVNRIIPTLLIEGDSLVKTKKFTDLQYVGDPCNTMRIFNELEVDEIIILDISRFSSNHPPNYKLIGDLANECFMPITYGGRITSIDNAKRIFELGVEKISINTSNFNNPNLIKELSDKYGSQSIIASIDVKYNFFRYPKLFQKKERFSLPYNPLEWALNLQSLGAGEILLTTVDKEGTWEGMDINLIRLLSEKLSIPLIAHGGAGRLVHIYDALSKGKASAVALGSMVTFQKKDKGVLVHFPDRAEIEEEIIKRLCV